jgi:quinolinate synthase
VRFRRLKEEELYTLCDQKITKEEVKLAMGSYTRLKKIISPEGKEVQKTVTDFINIKKTERLEIIENITNLEDFLWCLEGKLMNMLHTIKDEREMTSLIQKIISCEEAYQAKIRNVNEKVILYWLAERM